MVFAGSLDASVCVVGRDLGKDEVAAGQPLIGAGGRKVRAGIYRSTCGEPPPTADRHLDSVLSRALLTNLVPYKPPGNKAYATSVRERFRPFLAELIVAHWRGGDRIITLGNEAFQWFSPLRARLSTKWPASGRVTTTTSAEIDCEVVTTGPAAACISRRITLLPLPHPSPLNQR